MTKTATHTTERCLLIPVQDIKILPISGHKAINHPFLLLSLNSSSHFICEFCSSSGKQAPENLLH